MTGLPLYRGRWRREVEGRLDRVEARVDTEATLRAAMDADFSDLRIRLDAQEKILQGVQQTESEQNKLLTRLETTQMRHTATLDRHTARLTRLETKIDVGLRMIVGLLGGDTAALEGADGNNADGEGSAES